MQKKVKRQMVFKSLCLGILYLGLSIISNAEPLDTAYKAEIDAAIDSFKKYQREISCGKIDSGKTRYVFRVPYMYNNFIGMFYHGDSAWFSDGTVKKENPCLYGISSITINFKWPSMKPYRAGPIGYRDLKVNPNLVTATIKHVFTSGEPATAFEAENFIRLLKQQVIGYKGTETDIESDTVADAKVLTMGEYLADLGLYHYTFDKYIGPSEFEKKQGINRIRHAKREIFWQLDQDQRVLVYIVCEYLGLDKAQMVIENTICKQKKRLYIYDNSTLEIKYGGGQIGNWEKIQYAAIKQFEAFITEEDLP